MKHSCIYYLSILLITQTIFSQNFVEVTDATNPIAAYEPEDYWAGAAWIDYNNDNLLDLFVMNRRPGTQQRKNHLFKNEGDGNFSEVTGISITSDFGYWFGCSWADFNNDGYIDAFVNGLPSKLYLNNGDGTFSKVNSGDIADAQSAGVSSAWADYNNDGFLDVIQVWPNWLQGPPSVGQPDSPFLFTNSGPPNFEFTRENNSNFGITNGKFSFLQPTWSDFDDDGDMDLFIASGSGASNLDFIYKNQLTETGTAAFERYLESPMGTDSVEGNYWSLIDIDNDLDLDAYLTNWANVQPDNSLTPRPNKLYRNDNGAFVIVEDGEIVSDAYLTVGNTWHDFDNDGDLDCITVSDSTYPLAYYKNDGNGNFTKETMGQLPNTVKHQSSLVAGDYDNDGDLDIYVTGFADGAMLFNNDLQNGFNWIMLRLEGVQSNRSGIGTKIFLKAKIDGENIWQRRDLYAPNTFFGQSSLDIHFGLNTAEKIDSLKIIWPSGQTDTYSELDVNKLFKVIEGEGISVITSIDSKESDLPNEYKLMNNYPNPFNPSTTIKFSLKQTAKVELEIFNSLGESIRKLINEEKPEGIHQVKFDAGTLASGVYFFQLRTNDFVQTNKMVLLR